VVRGHRRRRGADGLCPCRSRRPHAEPEPHCAAERHDGDSPTDPQVVGHTEHDHLDAVDNRTSVDDPDAVDNRTSVDDPDAAPAIPSPDDEAHPLAVDPEPPGCAALGLHRDREVPRR